MVSLVRLLVVQRLIPVLGQALVWLPHWEALVQVLDNPMDCLLQALAVLLVLADHLSLGPVRATSVPVLAVDLPTSLPNLYTNAGPD
jgi:hypothetical protein